MLSCEEVSEDEDCCNHQAVLSLADGDAEVDEEEDCCNHHAVLSLAEGDAEVDEEEGEQEMLIGVKELMESVRLLMLRLNLIFTDALWDMSGCLWS